MAGAGVLKCGCQHVVGDQARVRGVVSSMAELQYLPGVQIGNYLGGSSNHPENIHRPFMSCRWSYLSAIFVTLSQIFSSRSLHFAGGLGHGSGASQY
jgi:hypothetical protein